MFDSCFLSNRFNSIAGCWKYNSNSQDGTEQLARVHDITSAASDWTPTAVAQFVQQLGKQKKLWHNYAR